MSIHTWCIIIWTMKAGFYFVHNIFTYIYSYIVVDLYIKYNRCIGMSCRYTDGYFLIDSSNYNSTQYNICHIISSDFCIVVFGDYVSQSKIFHFLWYFEFFSKLLKLNRPSNKYSKYCEVYWQTCTDYCYYYIIVTDDLQVDRSISLIKFL